MSELSIEHHPELRKALSMVPYSPLFGILWPIIVDQASYETRLELRWINDYFNGLCAHHRLSDEAKLVRILLLLHCYKQHIAYERQYKRITLSSSRECHTSRLSLTSASMSSGDAGASTSTYTRFFAVFDLTTAKKLNIIV